MTSRPDCCICLEHIQQIKKHLVTLLYQILRGGICKMKKRVLLGIFAAFMVLSLAACGAASESTSSDKTNTSTSTSSSSESSDPEQIKESAKSTDMDIIYRAVRSARAFNDEIAEKVAAQGDLNELYTYCDTARDSMSSSMDEIEAVEDESAADYKDAANGYISNIYMIAKYIQDFIDEQDYDALTNAQKSIEAVPYSEEQVLSARKAYLEQAGLTSEEIDTQISLG